MSAFVSSFEIRVTLWTFNFNKLAHFHVFIFIFGLVLLKTFSDIASQNPFLTFFGQVFFFKASLEDLTAVFTFYEKLGTIILDVMRKVFLRDDGMAKVTFLNHFLAGIHMKRNVVLSYFNFVAKRAHLFGV